MTSHAMRSNYPVNPRNRIQALALQTFELVVPEALPRNLVKTAMEAGQLAVGQYATPHTRQAAKIGAELTLSAYGSDGRFLSDEFIDCLHETIEMNARDELGQYYSPHGREASRVASRSILIQQGYTQEGEQ